MPTPAPTPDTPADSHRGRPSSGWRWYAGWTIALGFALVLTLAWCVALVWLVGRLASLVGL